MSQNPAQTEMSNPPKEQTKMTAAAPKKTLCKVICAIKVKGEIFAPGAEVELSPEDVAEFCDRRFKGPYAHSGEIGKGNAQRLVLRRAMPLAEWKDNEARRLAALKEQSTEE